MLAAATLGACSFTPAGGGLDPPSDGGALVADAGGDGRSADGRVPDGPALDAGFDPAMCPASYTVALGASRYRISSAQTSWTAAAADCADDVPTQTHLLVPDDTAELEALDDQLCAQASCNWTWLGIVATATGWRTLTDQPATLRWDEDEDEPDDDDQPDGPVAVAVKPVSHRMLDAPRGWSLRYVCECDGRATVALPAVAPAAASPRPPRS